MAARAGAASAKRTEQDLPLGVTALGSLALVGIMAVLPFLPGNFAGRLLLGVLIVVFGFFFVTVASRIVGLIGTSSNPVSGMTIATLMATCLLFLALGKDSEVTTRVGPGRKQVVESFLAVASHDDHVGYRASIEGAERELHVVTVVLYEEDGVASHG